MSQETIGRRFFMHCAHESIGVSAVAMARRLRRAHTPAPSATKRHAARICLVAGARDDGWEQSLATLTSHLDDERRVQCCGLPGHGGKLPALSHLAACECLVLLGRPDYAILRSLRMIEQYCRLGRALVVVRSASRAFPHWPGFDRDTLGGDYQGQHDTGDVEIAPVESARRHPIMAGVGPFISHGSLYENPWLTWDLTLLMMGTAGRFVEPVAWTRSIGGRRIFYTSLGHADDFCEPSFLRLLSNAVRWTCRLADGA